MLSSVLSLALGASMANGLVIRDSGCKIQFTADGAVKGAVGEISSGQVRIGSGVESTSFSLKEGGLTDPKGRGCWWTPPEKVLQCDDNQTPETGFEIGCDGSVTFNGKSSFVECETDKKDQYNIYLEKPSAGVNCNEVTLSADSCKKECPKPSTKPAPPPTTSQPAPQPTSEKPAPPQPTSEKPAPQPTTSKPAPQPTQSAPKGCPTNLDGDYEFPHLIVPVDKSKGDSAPGTSFFGEVSSDKASLFNFDIPSGDKGKQCSLVFLFPKQEDLETSSFTFSGAGALDFGKLKSPAKESTSYNSKPAVGEDYGTTTVAPGNSYLISTFDCPAGETVGYQVSASDDTSFRFFQDYNPSPIGLYITVC